MKQIYLKFSEDCQYDIDHTVQCWSVCHQTEAVLVREVRLCGQRPPLSTGVHWCPLAVQMSPLHSPHLETKC